MDEIQKIVSLLMMKTWCFSHWSRAQTLDKSKNVKFQNRYFEKGSPCSKCMHQFQMIPDKLCTVTTMGFVPGLMRMTPQHSIYDDMRIDEAKNHARS